MTDDNCIDLWPKEISRDTIATIKAKKIPKRKRKNNEDEDELENKALKVICLETAVETGSAEDNNIDNARRKLASKGTNHIKEKISADTFTISNGWVVERRRSTRGLMTATGNIATEKVSVLNEGISDNSDSSYDEITEEKLRIMRRLIKVIYVNAKDHRFGLGGPVPRRRTSTASEVMSTDTTEDNIYTNASENYETNLLDMQSDMINEVKVECEETTAIVQTISSTLYLSSSSTSPSASPIVTRTEEFLKPAVIIKSEQTIPKDELKSEEIGAQLQLSHIVPSSNNQVSTTTTAPLTASHTLTDRGKDIHIDTKEELHVTSIISKLAQKPFYWHPKNKVPSSSGSNSSETIQTQDTLHYAASNFSKLLESTVSNEVKDHQFNDSDSARRVMQKLAREIIYNCIFPKGNLVFNRSDATVNVTFPPQKLLYDYLKKDYEEGKITNLMEFKQYLLQHATGIDGMIQNMFLICQQIEFGPPWWIPTKDEAKNEHGVNEMAKEITTVRQKASRFSSIMPMQVDKLPIHVESLPVTLPQVALPTVSVPDILPSRSPSSSHSNVISNTREDLKAVSSIISSSNTLPHGFNNTIPARSESTNHDRCVPPPPPSTISKPTRKLQNPFSSVTTPKVTPYVLPVAEEKYASYADFLKAQEKLKSSASSSGNTPQENRSNRPPERNHQFTPKSSNRESSDRSSSNNSNISKKEKNNLLTDVSSRSNSKSGYSENQSHSQLSVDRQKGIECYCCGRMNHHGDMCFFRNHHDANLNPAKRWIESAAFDNLQRFYHRERIEPPYVYLSAKYQSNGEEYYGKIDRYKSLSESR